MITRLLACAIIISSCSAETQMTGSSRSRAKTLKQTSSDAVDEINEAPIANDDQADVNQGVEIEIDLLQNDSDPEDDKIELFELGSSENSEFSQTDDGKISYTANEDFVGIDTFTYKISDGMSVSEGQIKIKVCRIILKNFSARTKIDYKPNLADDEIIESVKGVSGSWCAWEKGSDSEKAKCPLSCGKVKPPIAEDGKSLYNSFDYPYDDNSGSCNFEIRVCTNAN